MFLFVRGQGEVNENEQIDIYIIYNQVDINHISKYIYIFLEVITLLIVVMFIVNTRFCFLNIHLKNKTDKMFAL